MENLEIATHELVNLENQEISGEDGEFELKMLDCGTNYQLESLPTCLSCFCGSGCFCGSVSE
ncbi:MAG TPA: hypothetical protein VH165_22570 [Kofleriaceae bacterium]|jgi:hypothetical protein|nr:hypothetical protein [Kofleriaceae bacterium]